MKKLLVSFVLILSMVFGFAAPVMASQDEIWVFTDGNRLTLDVAPITTGGRTLVPMRPIFESLGYTVEWISSTQQIKATRGNESIVMHINSKQAVVNGKNVGIDVVPFIKNGRTFVPLRFVGEASGKKVEWDGTVRSVYIGTVPSPKPIRPSTQTAKLTVDDPWRDYLSDYDSFHDFYDGSGVYDVAIIRTDITVRNFKFLEILVEYVDGSFVYNKTTLFSLNELTPDKPFCFTGILDVGHFNKKGISYVDSDNKVKTFLIIESLDGSGTLSLMEIS